MGKLESLVRASINVLDHCSIEDHIYNGAATLLAGVSNVTYLYLSAHWFEVGSLPTFQNLRHLKLVMHDCFCWELLTELLKKSPILESLVLERKVSYCMKQYSEEESSEEDRSENEEDSEQEVASEHEDE